MYNTFKINISFETVSDNILVCVGKKRRRKKEPLPSPFQYQFYVLHSP
jgi:hypothetical protein